MTTGELLIRGATIVSIDPQIGVLQQGDIHIRRDTIADVAPDLADRVAPDATVIDAQGTIAIPGFVDSHVHAWEGQLRGLGPMVDFGEYLGLTAFGYGPAYRPEDSYAGTMATALRALDAGITTLIDNGHNARTRDHSVAGVEALRESGIRAVHAIGSPFGSTLEHVPATAVELRQRYGGPLLSVRLFETEPTLDLWQFAKDEQLWVSTELGAHTADLDERFAALDSAGLLTAEHAFNHCYDLSEQVWKQIGASGAAVNLCPRSDAVFGLGTTVLPLEPALRHAAAIGLSNDNELSYGLSMFAEMQALTVRHRGERFRRSNAGETVDPDALNPMRLLEFATLGGAANAGLQDVIGSLTPGKQADIVLIRSGGTAAGLPADPVARLTAFAQDVEVDTVIVAGQLRKQGGRLVGVDLDRVRESVRASNDYLQRQ